MKKVILFLLIAILLVALPSCRQSPQFPENEEKPNEFSQYSAIQIDDSIKSALGVKDNEQVIRVYNISTERAFAKRETIEEVLASDDVLQEFYAVMKDYGIKVYTFDDDSNVVEIKYGISFTDNETTSVLLNHAVSGQFPQGAKILDVYYLWGRIIMRVLLCITEPIREILFTITIFSHMRFWGSSKLFLRKMSFLIL